MLTRIRNANLAYKDELLVPASKMNEALLEILDTEGFIERFAADGEGIDQRVPRHAEVRRKRERTITGLKRISKPGRRVYARRGELPARARRPRHRDPVDLAGRHDRPRRRTQGHRRRGPGLRVVSETMSRIGRQPIEIPSGVDVTVGDDTLVTVKGPRGTLTQRLHPNMRIVREEGVVRVERPDDESFTAASTGSRARCSRTWSRA